MASPTTAPAAGRVVGILQGIFLIVIAAVGLIGAWQQPEPLPRAETPMVLFDLSPMHALLLLVTGVLSLIAAQWRASLLWFSTAETVGFLVLFLYGTAEGTAGESRTPLALDAAENFLHAGLALIGFFIMCGISPMPWLASRRSGRTGR